MVRFFHRERLAAENVGAGIVDRCRSVPHGYSMPRTTSHYANMSFRPSLIIMLFVSACATVRAETGVGFTVTTDADCVIAVDNHVVSRVHKGERQFIPTLWGRHVVSAATKSGDYFEQSLDIQLEPSPSMTISFEKAHAERLEAEKRVSDLRSELSRVQTELARRRSIVDAVNYYADRWGKEMGLRDSRNGRSKNLNDAVDEQYWKNLGNPNQTAQAIGNLVMLGEIWRADALTEKALKNDIAVEAASAQMHYLGAALKDPEKYPPTRPELGYLAIVQDVKTNKNLGSLLTAPGRIEFRDRSGTLQISCAGLRRVTGSAKLHLSYKNQSKHGSLSISPTSSDKNVSRMILGDIYLACPSLTK